MSLLILAVVLPLAGGLLALLLSRSPSTANLTGAAGAVAGAVCGAIPAVGALLGSHFDPVRLDWLQPFGSFLIALDSLSALFLLVIFVLCGLAAVYATAYLRPYFGRKAIGAQWLWFNLLMVSMAMVTLARDALLFLIAWEIMSLTSFLLVVFDHEEAEVRQAGWTYIVATHIGAAFLIAMFILMARAGGGGTEFSALAAIAQEGPWMTGAVFLCAIVGFGTKAGFVPFHVWLPSAHPAAPSHVSAVMSGVMLKTAIYGLLRVLTFLGPEPVWWGWTLVVIGGVTGLFGIVSALGRTDIKRMLAYSSIENIGLIGLAIGLGVLGNALSIPALAVLGFAAALLHVVNHSLFKSLLFLGAGSVLQATHTRSMDRLGGLLKKMPRTGLLMIVGAVAISALPPFNGFASEFLMYFAALQGIQNLPFPADVPSLVAVPVLALIGALALAGFAGLVGIVFLGSPRTDDAGHAHDPGVAMLAPMWILAAACLGIGLASPVILPNLSLAVGSLVPGGTLAVSAPLANASGVMGTVSLGAGLLIGFIALVAAGRAVLLSGKPVGAGGTWGCGYLAPSVRMQYTATSFTMPILKLFSRAVGVRTVEPGDLPLFPESAQFEFEVHDTFLHKLHIPTFKSAESWLSRLVWMQHGRLRLYVLYIVAAVLVLLFWRLG